MLKVLQLGEISEPFIPLPLSSLLLNVQEDKERIESFLDKLLVYHTLENKKNLPHGICSGAGLEAARMLLQDDSKRGKDSFQL